MIVYEVRISVDRAIADDYRAWLDSHIREILTLPGFDRAELLAEDDDQGHRVWTVRYHLENRVALELYLKDHAPRMRAEGVRRFGDSVTTTRRVLELLTDYR
jgi:Domain of unknown function (DUF4286)